MNFCGFKLIFNKIKVILMKIEWFLRKNDIIPLKLACDHKTMIQNYKNGIKPTKIPQTH
jgi:hypothetical protein